MTDFDDDEDVDDNDSCWIDNTSEVIAKDDTNVKKVRFALQYNQVIDNTNSNTTNNDDDDGGWCAEDLWYTSRDFRAFKKQMIQDAHDILQEEKEALLYGESKTDTDGKFFGTVLVTSSLGKAYDGFCHVTTPDDILNVLTDCGIPRFPHARYIGLDRYLIREIGLDRRRRKLRLQFQMTWWQQQSQQKQQQRQQRKKQHSHTKRKSNHKKHCEDDTNSVDDTILLSFNEMLRNASRIESQPSRLYAQHVAQCAARSSVY